VVSTASIFGIAGVALIVIIAVLVAFEWRDRRHRGPSGEARAAGRESAHRDAGTRPWDGMNDSFGGF
jgi:hypothetical protein